MVVVKGEAIKSRGKPNRGWNKKLEEGMESDAG